ncbi:MAG: four-carbon acid sugar kinase family protein [Candidatus Rokubacteria bacterium]|nr:four-carbon acid sugar kinase family protein [Candidatus Rokubacteria bacterium]
MPLTILADDLTGACDAGAPFAGPGRVGLFVEPAAPGADWNVASVDTESRALPPAEAADRIRRAAGRMGPRLRHGRVFKKIDSSMRGAVGAEVVALCSAAAARTALVCPAFPAERRTVVGGILRIHGLPAHESPVGRDPDYPAPTSDLLEILAGQLGHPVGHVPLETVRRGDEALRHALARAAPPLVVADAVTEADLDALARAVIALPATLLAGSAGLARRLASALGHAGDPAPLPAGRAWLIVAGSLHPATTAQIETLATAGVTGLWIEPGGSRPDPAGIVAALAADEPAFVAARVPAASPGRLERAQMAKRLACAATAALSVATPALVCATGGETALALTRALGAARLELLGAPGPGLALGEMIVPGASGPRRSGRRLLTKAGGFGPPELFVTLITGTRR